MFIQLPTRISGIEYKIHLRFWFFFWIALLCIYLFWQARSYADWPLFSVMYDEIHRSFVCEESVKMAESLS